VTSRAGAAIHRSRGRLFAPASRSGLLQRGLAVAVVAGTAAGFSALPAVANAASRPRLQGLATVAATPHFDGMRRIGAVARSQEIVGAVALNPRNPAALEEYATVVSTPGTAQYHRFVTPSGFARLFGPTRSSIAAVSSQLRADGLRLGSVSANGLLVHFSGTAAQVGAAFHTSLARFHLADGSVGTATTSAIRLPAAIAGSVATVVGLDNLVHPHPVSLLRGGRRAAGREAARPSAVAHIAGAPNACAAAQSTAADLGGLTDSQIAAAYGVDGLYSAGDLSAGKSIAIFELEPYSAAEIKTFDTCYFGTAAATLMQGRLHTVAVDGGQQVGIGSGEAELDIEDVSALAPQAKIYVYEAPNSEYGAIDDYNTIVSQNKGQEISSSWGACEEAEQSGQPGVQALENVIFEEAATQGQSAFSAAGDDGSDDCAGQAATPSPPILSVDDPGSQPFVTSVGGTSIDNATQPPVERVWNDGASFGAGGGGISATWTEPSWQLRSRVPGMNNAAVVNRADAYATSHHLEGGKFCLTDSTAGATATACREVPDVSAQADEFTGAITVYWGGSWTTFGGTSSSTPLWAAMTSDISASGACGTRGAGFIDPELYALASNPTAYAASFNDIKVGDNDSLGADGLYPATTGYDMASGLGSPKVTGPKGTAGLAHYLCGQSTSATAPTITSVSPATLTKGGGTLTITGTGFESGATSKLAGVQVGAVSLPTSAITDLTPTSFNLAVPAAAHFAPPGTPAGGEGRYYVSVTSTSHLTSRSGPSSAFEIVSGGATTPVVTGVGPSGGNESGKIGARSITTTIYGAGFTGATAVTFGGVTSPHFTVNATGDEIIATVPRFSAGTTTCRTGDNAVADVCQVDVVVTRGANSSFASTLLPPYQGAFAFDNSGDFEPPPGCGCESAPQPTEFDYLPTPHISRLTADVARNGKSYADENGGTVVTLTGVGLDVLGLEWLDVGGAPNSDNSFFGDGPTFVSGTKLQFVMPPPATMPTRTGTFSVPVYVQTLASPNSGNISSKTPAPSNAASLSFAPNPSVVSVSTGRPPAAGPATGRTKLTIRGAGFTAASVVTFTDEFSPFGAPFSASTSLDFTVVSRSEITLSTPDTNAGVDDVQVCTTTGCSTATPRRDSFTFYPPGNPSVASSSPAAGAAAGGTRVTIRGTNLGFVTGVRFGKVAAKTFQNAPALLDSGSTKVVTAVAPPGKAGTTVSITLETLESAKNGKGFTKAVKRAIFKYAK
jgi:hypothetical protein